MSNYFDQLADRQLTSPQKTKERVKQKWADKRAKKTGEDGAPMKMTWQEQMRHDDAVLAKLYRRWRAELRDSVVASHGGHFKELMRLVRNLEWSNAPKVVEYVAGAAWLQQAEEDTRFVTLSYIESNLIRARIRHGLSPIDDGLWDEEPGPFRKIRKILFGY